MSEEKNGIFSKTMFSYEGYGCDCVMDIENVAPGEAPKATLKVCADYSRQLLFSYAPKEGLNLTGVAGGTKENNILGKLLALPKDDIGGLMKFFESYGFLYPLTDEEYASINALDLFEIVNRVKATIALYNSINRKNYKGVLVHAAYLLYSPKVTINVLGKEYSTCVHKFTQLLWSNNLFPDLTDVPEVSVTGKYSVPDTFLEKKNLIDIEFFNAVRSGANTNLTGSKEPLFKNLLAMYTGCRDLNEETRNLIDFFYHFQTEVSIFKDVKYGSIIPYSHIDENTFSEPMKAALLKVARIVVAEEINYNIRGIHPKYDGGRLTASWQVDNLIEALYFSIFYMRTGEIYKECENPNCKRNKYFLVEATRENKKYCCPQCSNAAAAQRHRLRQLGK